MEAVPLTPEENTQWYIDGIQGFHEGFYKALYKTGHVTKADGCLDGKTVHNMQDFSELAADPFSIFKNVDIEKDIGLFSEAAEIFENLAACKFEAPALDLMKFCNANTQNCAVKTLTDNLTKNMFVLVGKITSIAELF